MQGLLATERVTISVATLVVLSAKDTTNFEETDVGLKQEEATTVLLEQLQLWFVIRSSLLTVVNDEVLQAKSGVNDLEISL